MKNHESVDGHILQTNKKWSQLKQSQREWIRQITNEEHIAYIKANSKLPMKNGKQVVIDKVMERISERSIWLPPPEAQLHIAKYIDKANKKSGLFHSVSNGDSKKADAKAAAYSHNKYSGENAMSVYVCGKCHFLFERSGPVDRCPDCGHGYIQIATTEEKQEYRKNKAEAIRCLKSESEK